MRRMRIRSCRVYLYTFALILCAHYRKARLRPQEQSTEFVTLSDDLCHVIGAFSCGNLWNSEYKQDWMPKHAQNRCIRAEHLSEPAGGGTCRQRPRLLAPESASLQRGA